MKKRRGFLYVLRHPALSFADWGLSEGEYLYKIGVTTRTVEIRLKQHNTDFTKAAGKIVQETGQAWEIQLIVAVEDVYVAESIFWGHSKYADIPFLGGVEIVPMTIGDVESAINALLRLSNGSAKL
jgi:hypothetical protein